MRTHDIDESAKIEELAQQEICLGTFSSEEVFATMSDEDRRVYNAAKAMFEELNAKYNGTVDKETVWEEVLEKLEELENGRKRANIAKA